MDPREDIRENRLSLLQRLIAPFQAIADFRLAAGAAS
jgi:glycyl-tRNA synthetase beta subunit